MTDNEKLAKVKNTHIEKYGSRGDVLERFDLVQKYTSESEFLKEEAEEDISFSLIQLREFYRAVKDIKGPNVDLSYRGSVLCTSVGKQLSGPGELEEWVQDALDLSEEEFKMKYKTSYFMKDEMEEFFNAVQNS